MFKAIRDEIKLIVDRVKAGNAYRAEKYKDYKPAKPLPLSSYGPAKVKPMFASLQELKEIDVLKMHYQYWDEWTGGRYERVENPYIDKEYFAKYHRLTPALADVAYKRFIKNVKMGEVLRSNAVTGYWEPYTEVRTEDH